jgi:hypothetical protein
MAEAVERGGGMQRGGAGGIDGEGGSFSGASTCVAGSVCRARYQRKCELKLWVGWCCESSCGRSLAKGRDREASGVIRGAYWTRYLVEWDHRGRPYVC